MVSIEQLHDLDAPAHDRRGGTLLGHGPRDPRGSENGNEPVPREDIFAAPLARIRTALAADHVAAIAWHDDADRGTVAASVGAALLAPGVMLVRASSAALDEAADGRPAVIDTADADTGLELLAAAGGLRTAMAIPFGGGAYPDGMVYVAWARDAAPVKTAQPVVEDEAAALAAVLEPPVLVGASVLVCHHDRLVAEGIARQAERRLGVIADSCIGLDELLRALERHRPNLIACSETLGDGAVLPAVGARVRAAGAAAPLLALARAETPRSVDEALHAGIAGYVALGDGADRILEVMAAVLDGRAVLPAPATTQAPVLTEREGEVLEGLDRGLSYVAIARELQVAPSTVKSHARQLFRKLEVGSRTAALHRARSEGLL